jgi:Uma2 family endonuclease
LNQNPQFVAGGNEAGMVLGGDRRGADAAVWHRSALGPYTGQFRRVPPLLAIEVAGLYDDEPMLRDKARWYLEHDVCTVWLVLPDTREVVVLAGGRDQRFGVGSRLPEPEGVPGLTPAVDDFFTQLR